MTGMIDWATDRARMILVFVAMSLAAGIEFNLRCPLDGEYKVGTTWAETH